MSITVLTAVAALAAVLGLILLVGRLVRASGRLPRPSGGRLAVTEVLALDASRRLRLVRCDGREVLLLTGGPADVVVGWVDSKEVPGRGPLNTPVMVGLDPTTSRDPNVAENALCSGAAPLARGGRVEPDHDGTCCAPPFRTPALRVLLWSVLLLLPLAAHAQSINIDLGTAGEAGATGRLVQITALITVLSLAPSLLVMMTAFTRIVIVLSLLRSALSTQGTPPNTVLIGLALFLTYFVMQPVLDQAWTAGIQPMIDGRIAEAEGLRLTADPFRHFMLGNMRPGDLAFFEDLAHLPPSAPGQASWRAVVPAFMVGELRRAFEMGFLLFLPFLVIDMVVASVLMSLGMMMLPPSVVSLPFKLIFFVLVDGWRLVAGSLVRSFAGS